MAEESEYAKQEQLRIDVRAFAFACARHWSACIIAILGGSIATFYQTTTGNPLPIALAWTVGLLGFFAAAFLGWQDERRTKESVQEALAKLKAIPNISGFWVRADGGTIELRQTGDTLTGSFPHGGVDHEITGTYNKKIGKFEIITKRTEALRQRHTQSEDYWVLNKDILLFDCLDNVNHEHEMGILKRRGT